MNTFDIVISIGYACRMAMMLSRLNLRKQAFPFDWNGADLISITQAIGEDFANIYDFESSPEMDIEKQCFKHKIYNSWNFCHLDVRNEKIRKLYDRRINRLRKVLNSSYNVLFTAWNHTLDKDIINKFIETIKIKYPKLKFHVLFIQEIYTKKNIVEFIENNDYYSIYKIHGPINSDKYPGHNQGTDLYINLFNNFKFDIKIIPNDDNYISEMHRGTIFLQND